MENPKENSKLPLETPQSRPEIPNKHSSKVNESRADASGHTPRTISNHPTSKNNTPRADVTPFKTVRQGVVYANRSTPMMTTLLFLLSFRGKTPIEQEALFKHVDFEIEQKPHRRSNLKRSWTRMEERGLVKMFLKDYYNWWELTILGDHVAIQIYNTNCNGQTTNSNGKYNANFERGIKAVTHANKEWELANKQGIPL